jgi:hypothetical protein
VFVIRRDDEAVVTNLRRRAPGEAGAKPDPLGILSAGDTVSARGAQVDNMYQDNLDSEH